MEIFILVSAHMQTSGAELKGLWLNLPILSEARPEPPPFLACPIPPSLLMQFIFLKRCVNSLKRGDEALCAIDWQHPALLPLPECAISLLLQSLAETELWTEAIWPKVNPDKAETTLLGRERKSWRAGRQCLLHLLKDFCPFFSKAFMSWCTPSPGQPNSSNVWKRSLSFWSALEVTSFLGDLHMVIFVSAISRLI